VGKLRTHEDKKVAELAKETVKKWKHDVAGQKKPEGTPSSTSKAAGTAGATSGPSQPPTVASVTAQHRQGSISNGSVKEENATANAVKKNRDANTDGIPKDHTGDKARDGNIVLLYNSIVLDASECIVNFIFIRLTFSFDTDLGCNQIPRITDSQANKLRKINNSGIPDKNTFTISKSQSKSSLKTKPRIRTIISRTAFHNDFRRNG
jgi:hypothetical protein